MNRKTAHTYWPLAACGVILGCADIRPIEDGAQYGSVEVVKDWFTSVALVESQTGVVLIDGGFRTRAMKRALSDRGIAAEDVDHVLLSHGHGDHVGALALYTNAEIWALAPEADLLEEEMDPEAQAVQFVSPNAVSTFGDVTIEVFSMPGHTAGSAAYLVGDTLILGDNALIDGQGDLVMVPEKRSEDPAGAEESLANLAQTLSARETDVQHLVPSHSGGSSDTQILWDWLP